MGGDDRECDSAHLAAFTGPGHGNEAEKEEHEVEHGYYRFGCAVRDVRVWKKPLCLKMEVFATRPVFSLRNWSWLALKF